MYISTYELTTQWYCNYYTKTQYAHMSRYKVPFHLAIVCLLLRVSIDD